MNIEILTKENKLLARGIEYFWKCWGNESNFIFYKDCIENSIVTKDLLPNFYLLLERDKIIGSYALLTNDIISRQDLMPWFACLYIEESFRNQGFAERLLNHGLHEAKRMCFDRLFLSTDLNDFYEKKGWDFYSKGYGVGGDEFKIYTKSAK